jgi:protocatechuate 3,4-dioxygenase, alpha subunit
MSRQTPSQTIGPYFAYGLVPEQYGFDLTSAFPARLIEPDDPAPRVTLTGRVLDGDGAPVSDALIEFWLERGDAPPAMCRIGTGTDAQCRYSVDLPRPEVAGGNEAPHLDVIVMARGMLLHAITRIYFDEEAKANAADATLEAVPAARRHTLIARATGPGHYRFDIRLQGENETVFFAL